VCFPIRRTANEVNGKKPSTYVIGTIKNRKKRLRANSAKRKKSNRGDNIYGTDVINGKATAKKRHEKRKGYSFRTYRRFKIGVSSVGRYASVKRSGNWGGSSNESPVSYYFVSRLYDLSATVTTMFSPVTTRTPPFPAT